MSNVPEQYIYDKKLWMVGETPVTIKPSGKFPVIANQQWNTIEDVEKFINDPNSTAIPGMILTVINDPDETKNGMYFVDKVCDSNEETGSVQTGSIMKVADNIYVETKLQDVNNKLEQVTNKVESVINVIGGEDNIFETIENLERKHDDDIVNLKYKSNAQENWKTEKVGGVSAGKTPSYFEDKTVYDVLDEILYPTLQPTIVQPSVTLNYSGSTIIEVGTNLPNDSDFNKSINRGTSSYNNSDGDKYYAGTVETETFTMSPKSFGEQSEEGIYTTSYSVTFNNGSTLLDNKGNVSTVKSFVRGTKTSTCTFVGVYPIYINTSDVSEMTKQTLQDYISGNVSYKVEIPTETPTNHFEFHIPEHLSLSSVKQFNPTNNQYDADVNYDQDGTVTHNGITYKKYIRNKDGAVTGTTKYEIIINKK